MIVFCGNQSAYCRSSIASGKDGYGRRFTTRHSMAVIQATAVTTRKPSPYRKEAAGKTSNGTANCRDYRLRRLEASFTYVAGCKGQS